MKADNGDRVRTLLTRPAVQVPMTATLRAVAQTLAQESIGAVVVRDTKGIVSERDIVRALADGADPDQERAADVMTEDFAWASPTDGVHDVAALMRANEIRHVPLMEDEVVVGVVSERDVLARVLAETEASA